MRLLVGRLNERTLTMLRAGVAGSPDLWGLTGWIGEAWLTFHRVGEPPPRVRPPRIDHVLRISLGHDWFPLYGPWLLLVAHTLLIGTAGPTMDTAVSRRSTEAMFVQCRTDDRCGRFLRRPGINASQRASYEFRLVVRIIGMGADGKLPCRSKRSRPARRIGLGLTFDLRKIPQAAFASVASVAIPSRAVLSAFAHQSRSSSIVLADCSR